jgi:hypothetical protein
VLLELGEIAIGIAQATRLAQPDAVDDGRVVERVGDDRVLLAEHGLEQAAVRIPARGVEDGVLGAEKTRERCFELLVHGLRTADEAHGRHAIAEPVDGAVRRFSDGGVAGQAQIVVSAEVDHLGVVGADLARLRACDHPLGLEQALFAEFRQLAIETLIKGGVHGVSPR